MTTNNTPALHPQRGIRAPRERRLARMATRRVFPPSRSRPRRPPKHDDDFTDVLLPSQFFTPFHDSHAFWRGEQRLLFAVLQDAVSYWFRYGRGCTPRERRLFAETKHWFWSEERSWLFAFVRICELLDLDPNYIRRGLILWQEPAANGDTSLAGLY